MSAARPDRRTLLAGAGALAASGILAACGGKPEAPPAVPAGPSLASPTPVTDPERFERFVKEIHDAIAAADKAKDARKLAPRVIGSAAQFRGRTYELMKKAPEWSAQLTLPGASIVVPISSVGTDFPRTALALVEDSREGGVPFFLALQQKDARSPYATWGWAQQAVGVQMPKVEDQKVGAEPVAADDSTLVMKPSDAIALYAKVLSDGDAADPKDLLAPSPFQTESHKGIQGEREKLNKGVERDQAATVKEIYTVKKGEYAALRTDEGGAIVMATLESTRRITMRGNATMTLKDEPLLTKVAGRATFKKEFVRTYGSTVALFVPSAEAGGKIQPIGATRTTLTVSGS